MRELSFKSIAKAWRIMTANPQTVQDLKREIPSLNDPSQIKIRNNTQRGDQSLHLEFIDILAAIENASEQGYVKRMIQNWLKAMSDTVQVINTGDPNSFSVKISRIGRFTEAAIPILRRDSKNRIKRVYKCVGGRKNGKKVADMDQCLQVPDFYKKARLSVTKRAKHGQTSKSKKSTKLTNIVAKKAKRRNAMLKKSRGF